MTDIGPRVAGSAANEIETVQFFEERLNEIKRQAHSAQKIDLNLQIVSGTYFLDYKPSGSFNVYKNAQNIVARLRGKQNSSILVNAHFDSVPTSPGESNC